MRITPGYIYPGSLDDTLVYEQADLDWVMLITQVCRQWRDVAINEPTLWTDLPLFSPEWARIMLGRSRNAGINVKLEAESLQNTGLVAALLDNASRFKLFRAMDGNDNLQDLLFSKFPPTPTPLLKSLDIWGYRNPSELCLPDSIFPNANQLKYLRLDHVDIKWTSHLFSSLTTLILRDISSSGRPSISEFRSVTARMPRLEHLTLVNALPTTLSTNSSSSYGFSPIPLLSLQTLEINSDLFGQKTFFNNIGLPRDIIHVESQMTYDELSAVKLPCVLSSMAHEESASVLCLRARYLSLEGMIDDDDELPMIEFITKEKLGRMLSEEGPDEPGETSPGFRLRVHKAEPWAIIFTELFNSFDWSRLLQLNLTHLFGNVFPLEGGADLLSTIIGTLSNLHTIMVGKGTAKCLVQALVSDSDKCVALASAPAIFPALRKIKMTWVTFRIPNTRGVDPDELLRCLTARCVRDAEVELLALKDCRGLIKEDKWSLMEVVGDLYVSGNGAGYDVDDVDLGEDGSDGEDENGSELDMEEEYR